jgi:D-threo-aldose 1-dehydrogenase
VPGGPDRRGVLHPGYFSQDNVIGSAGAKIALQHGDAQARTDQPQCGHRFGDFQMNVRRKAGFHARRYKAIRMRTRGALRQIAGHANPLRCLQVFGRQHDKAGVFDHGRPNKMVNDYSADATLRSIEDSLERLQTDRLDIVWIHDIAQDFYRDEWLEHFNAARKGAFRVLTRLREEGVIGTWGLGVNRVEPCELTLDLEEAQPDGFLLAGRYTLLDHDRALQRLMTSAHAQNVDIVVGGPYSSGILVGGEHFEYRKASAQIIAKVEAIKSIAQRFNVDIKAAALQFSLANPAVAAVIPGSSRPGRIEQDIAALTQRIPAEFWQAMVKDGLISPLAPLPKA